MRGMFVLVTVAALAGCYDQPKPNCTFTCDPALPAEQQCPADYTCVATDRLCHLTQPGGGPAPCPEVLPDASGDATDAPVDGPADAPADAPAADADIDASVPDANVDASSPDANVDAPGAPDANIDAPGAPDANVDANLPDAMVAAVELISCSGETPVLTISAATGAYVPMNSTVTVGDVVQFTPGNPSHDMTSGTPPTPDGVFATPLGSTACLRFNQVATYAFYCTVHEFTGSITVDP
jgi:plastocyanin